MPWITMPQLGENVADGTIGRWLRQPGERVARGEGLVEVITEKASAEVPSEVEGVLERILVPEGAVVATASPIAFVLEAGEQPPDGEPVPPGGLRPHPLRPPEPPSESVAAAPAAAQPPAGPAATPGAAERPGIGSQAAASLAAPAGVPPLADLPGRVSPPVLQLAREAGVDLADVRGTGPAGRITREDVTSYLVRQRLAGAAPSAGRERGTMAHAGQGDRALGRAQSRSSPGARVSVVASEVDVSAVHRLVEHAGATYLAQERIPLDPLAFAGAAVVDGLGRLESARGRGRSTDVGERSAGTTIEFRLATRPADPVLIRSADRLSIHGLNVALHGRETPEGAVAAFAEPPTAPADSTAPAPAAVVVALADGGPSLGVFPPPRPGTFAITAGAAVRRPAVASVDGGDAIVIRTVAWVSIAFDESIDAAVAERLLLDVRRWLESVDERTPLR